MERAVFVPAAALFALGAFNTALAAPDIPGANAAMTVVVKKAKAPGGGFAVAYHGRIVDVKGFGFADVATRTPVGTDTMFALASNSKPITATAVMKLVDERKLTRPASTAQPARRIASMRRVIAPIPASPAASSRRLRVNTTST